MQRRAAAVGSAAFFAVAPGVAAGLVPWLLTRWEAHDPMPWGWSVRSVGIVLIVLGLPVLVAAFVRFAVEGLGTPAPVAPTENLVVGGLFRWVRNPMYLSVWGLVAGQALLLARPSLGWYLLALVAAMVTFVHAYEEPTLRRSYGAEYDAYVAAVPRWLPRRPR